MYQMEKLLHKGKVRSLHRAIVGDQRMPDDEFREGRARISEFQDALKIVERTVNKFTAAGALFNDVNDDLSSEMKKFFQTPTWRIRLSSRLAACAKRSSQ